MKRAGQIVLVPFPHTDLTAAKMRPVLLLRRASGRFDDWSVCMGSSRLPRAEPDLDETITEADGDFPASGLKVPSLVRLSRPAVIDGTIMAGAIGAIGDDRLNRIRRKPADWLTAPE